jgi:hypothetical protein
MSMEHKPNELLFLCTVGLIAAQQCELVSFPYLGLQIALVQVLLLCN